MNRSLKKRALIILVSLTVAAGCSSTRPVAFQSDPPGAVLRLEGKEYHTPCIVDIPDEKTTVELALGHRRVMEIEVPEDYSFWDRTGEAAGTAGAYTLYGLAAPLIVTGVIGESIFAGGYQVSGEETAGGLVVIFGALTGRVIGSILAAGGESLEESSALEDISILAVFPPATPSPPPQPVTTSSPPRTESENQ